MAQHREAAARAAMREKQRALRGRVVEVLVDGPAPESEWLRVGRTAAQAPEIDGVTYLTGGLPPAGKLVAARITRTSESDLVGELGIGCDPFCDGGDDAYADVEPDALEAADADVDDDGDDSGVVEES